jgi:hypothetical protein
VLPPNLGFGHVERWRGTSGAIWHTRGMNRVSLAPLTLKAADVFPATATGLQTAVGADETYLQIESWPHPVMFFVGRNGSGKSRTAKVVAERLRGELLSTDRLVGLMAFDNYGWGSVPRHYKGVPLDSADREQMRRFPERTGLATDALYALREQPEVWLRVAAFIQRTLGRAIDLRESAGYLDPYVRVGDVEFSLLREEGHGLRELVVLLTAAYRRDWGLLVVDEPELHLHPSMSRLWLTELNRECTATDRKAIVVTHNPDMLRPKAWDDLGAIWHFMAGRSPIRIADEILEVQRPRVTASLEANPHLISQLVFSPRPVLVEGPHDVAALTASLVRTQPAEVGAQTELVECGGSGGVAMWLEIGTKLGLDLKAIADIDACLAPEVQRVMDARSDVATAYREELAAEPARTAEVIRPLINAMTKAGVPNDDKSRARWLAASVPVESGHAARRDKLLAIWRDAGLWLHPQGTLEDVLSITHKGALEARVAASKPGPIDVVSKWCAYELDPTGDVEVLLNISVERVAHSLMEALRLSPGTRFDRPVGSNATSDDRLVRVIPLDDGRHRIVVREPEAFAGYWLEFTRETPSTELVLKPPINETS